MKALLRIRDAFDTTEFGNSVHLYLQILSGCNDACQRNRMHRDSQGLLSNLFSSVFQSGRTKRRHIIRIRRLCWHSLHHKTNHIYKYYNNTRLWSLRSSLRSSLACRNGCLLIFNLKSFLNLSQPDGRETSRLKLRSVCSVATQQPNMELFLQAAASESNPK